MTPRWSKMPLRWPQNAPRWPQDGPKMAQDGAKMALRRPEMAQDGPDMALRWPRMAKKLPKIASKWHPKMVQGQDGRTSSTIFIPPLYILSMRMPTSAASMAQSIAKPLCIGLLLRFLQQPMILLLRTN